nr:metal ABC transporter substrate-binding protein [Streptomyces durbertensis]
MNARRRPLIPAAAAATAACVLSLSACGDNGAGTTSDGKLNVVASFYPMQFVAERVGGEHVAVETLTAPGAEPHDLELGAKQTARLGEAGLVVYLKGFQPAVDEAVEQSGVEHVADAASFTKLSAVNSHGNHETHDHGDDDHDDDHGHDDKHGDDDHGHDDDHGDDGHDDKHGDDDKHDDHGHDHDGEDPHVWLDPVKYAEISEGVAGAMAKADPDNAADYRKNAAELVKELKQLDGEFKDGLKNTETRTFITTHAAFGYLAARYDLDEEAIALDPESEPTPARMRQLTAVVKKEKVNTVFFETLASDRTAKALAGDLKLRTDVLDPVEGITDRTRGEDYLEVMRSNLEALKKALGAK